MIDKPSVSADASSARLLSTPLRALSLLLALAMTFALAPVSPLPQAHNLASAKHSSGLTDISTLKPIVEISEEFLSGGLLDEGGNIIELDVIRSVPSTAMYGGPALVYGNDFEVLGHIEQDVYNPPASSAPSRNAFALNGVPKKPGGYWLLCKGSERAGYTGEAIVFARFFTRATNLYFGGVGITEFGAVDNNGCITKLPQVKVILNEGVLDSKYYEVGYCIEDDNGNSFAYDLGDKINPDDYCLVSVMGRNGYAGGLYAGGDTARLFPNPYSENGTIDGCSWSINDGVLSIAPLSEQEAAAHNVTAGEIDDNSHSGNWPWRGTMWSDKSYSVERVEVAEGVKITGSMAKIFADYPSLHTVDLSNLTMDGVTDMAYAFSGDRNLQQVKLGTGCNTENVTSWTNTFSDCKLLTGSNPMWTGFDFDGATNMRGMLKGCDSLLVLPSTFYVPAGTKIDNCFSAESRDLLRTPISGTSEQARQLASYDWLGSGRMWQHACSCTDSDAVVLHRPDESTFTAYQCPLCKEYYTSMSATERLVEHCWLPLGGCDWIITDDGELIVRPRAEAAAPGMLPSISGNKDVPWLTQRSMITSASFKEGVQAGKNLTNAFDGCHRLKRADLTNLRASANTCSYSLLFAECVALEEVVFPESGFVTGSVESLEGMFFRCVSLTNLDISSFDTSGLTSTSEMFQFCGGLKRIGGLGPSEGNGSRLCDLSNVRTFDRMFAYCVSLKKAVIKSGMPTSGEDNWYSAGNMFLGCESLNSVVFNGEKFHNLKDANGIFRDCPSLEEVPSGLALPSEAESCFAVEHTAAIAFEESADSSVKGYDYAEDNRVKGGTGIQAANLGYNEDVTAGSSGVSLADLEVVAGNENVDVADFEFGGWYSAELRYDESTRNWVRDRYEGTETAGPAESGEYSVLLIAGDKGKPEMQTFARSATFTPMSVGRLSVRAASAEPSCYGITYLRFTLKANAGGGGVVTPPTPADPTTPSEPEQPENPGSTDEPAAPEAPAVTVNRVTYTVDENTGTATVMISPKATSATVRSSVTIDGKTYKVTTLTAAATEGCSKLKSLTVAKGITKISKGALANCPKLTSLSIGRDVTAVPTKALAKCTKLKTVKIWSGKLTKKQLTDLLKGSKITTVKLCGNAAKAKKTNYSKWAKAIRGTIKVKNA